MYIEHIALWTNQLERMRDFYETYFQAKAGNKYRNPSKGFESYFLAFSSGARLELIAQPGFQKHPPRTGSLKIGYTHLSVATGSERTVDELTDRLYLDGYKVIKEPHRTGDGYYESVVLDPDGNHLEITV
jgi:lactoylglutathione lyase